MKIKDPRELLNAIDRTKLQEYLGYQPLVHSSLDTSDTFHYSEPYGEDVGQVQTTTNKNASHTPNPSPHSSVKSQDPEKPQAEIISGQALPLGDFIDTDAVSEEAPYLICGMCESNCP
jgi:hypothetical protein